MKRKIVTTLISMALSLSLFAEPAIESKTESKASLNIGILNGPSAVPAAYIMENTENLNFQIFSGADFELPKLLKGELDVGVLPPNAAAKVWNKSGQSLVVLAVVGQGNLSLLTTDKNCKSIKDLSGKTVYCAGRGATPEYMFRYILEKNNFYVSDENTPADKKSGKSSVTLDFTIPNPEIAGALVSGKAQYILVPEPFATVALMKGKVAGVTKVCNLTDEYAKLKGESNFPMTLLVTTKKTLADASKASAIASYLSVYEDAVRWTLKNPSEAGILVEKHTLGLNAQIAAASIPNGAYVFVPAEKSHSQIENLLQIFLSQNPDSIGGKLPDETFYQK